MRRRRVLQRGVAAREPHRLVRVERRDHPFQNKIGVDPEGPPPVVVHAPRDLEHAELDRPCLEAPRDGGPGPVRAPEEHEGDGVDVAKLLRAVLVHPTEPARQGEVAEREPAGEGVVWEPQRAVQRAALAQPLQPLPCPPTQLGHDCDGILLLGRVHGGKGRDGGSPICTLTRRSGRAFGQCTGGTVRKESGSRVSHCNVNCVKEQRERLKASRLC
ncbi:hypothetical protein B0H15DRAFT_377118 [Mycena belliarum]|uniref:Uncharacterized protein n=1 Tax=Mycena belliarum TaxID=1033014 RepID=A0AAD6U4J9_9AGAR|nr:hypothetical protein B0H15DRAFT_377118 [Mycena belliae]